MYQTPALAGIERHARTSGSDAFPILGAHIGGSEFQYPDLSWKELCGMMANLVAESGGNKGQLSSLVEALCREVRLVIEYLGEP